MIREIIDKYRERFGKNRNVDLVAQAHFIRCCGWMYAFFFLILRFTVYNEGIMGIFKCAVVSIPPAVIMGIPVYLITNMVGNWFGIFYGGGEANWTTDEMIAADLDKIRFSKRAGKFEDALKLANTVLDRFPEHPEVMFLKAQILWEGFGYGNTAKRCLQRIMEKVPEKEVLHRWAVSYMNTIDASQVDDKDESEDVIRHNRENLKE